MAGTTRYNKTYACTMCETETPHEKLTVKKAVFTGMGAGARTFRSRRLHWLCPQCLAKDPEWTLEPYVAPEDRDDPKPVEPVDGQLAIPGA